MLVDGVATPSLGGTGAVRRDLPLDPDLIKDGKLAAGQPVRWHTAACARKAESPVAARSPNTPF